MARNLSTSAIIGVVLVLPFVILELVNRRPFSWDFPIPLFLAMWFLSTTFILVVMSIVRNPPAGTRHVANGLSLLPRVALAILIAGLWVSLVVDQTPCFLGVPNCD